MLGTLLGNYRVVEKLGEGGMGVVYIGRHEALGRRVVVKVLRSDLSSNADMVQRFFREAQAATEIRNPGIAQVFDFGTAPDRRAYFVMELLEGETLSARLRRGRLDHATCCRLGRQVANVLQAAHAASITHRDLKPDNLFLVPDTEVIGGERVKVLDFGIAKLAGAAHADGFKTGTGVMMGTPSYMSPEQCRNATSADARSDIYSLGCILFEMVCGRPPFTAGGLADIIASHLHDPPPHPQNIAPDMPPGLSALIAKMLSKHPDARLQSMSAVSQALDEILRTLGDPVAAGPSTRPAPSPAAAPATPTAALTTPIRAPAVGARAPSPAATPPGAAAPRGAAFPAGPRAFPPAAFVPATGAELAPAAPGPTLPLNVPTPSPQLYPTPTTLSGSAGVTQRSDRGASYHRSVVLSGLIVAGAVTAISAVLAGSGSSAPEATARLGASVDFNQIDTTAQLADAALSVETAPAPAPTPPSPAPSAPSAHPAPPLSPSAQPSPLPADAAPASPPASASDLQAECRGYQVDRHWIELEQCADKLKSLDAVRAAVFHTRAAEETRSAPRIAAVEAAVREKNLRRARSELDQVWPESVEYARIKRKVDAAEAAAITDLAAQLDRIRDSDCEEYKELLAKERALASPRVTTEAARRTPCPKPVQCVAEAFATQGREHFASSRYAHSLASYESAYACNPATEWSEKAFIAACNLRSVAKARLHWRRIPQAMRARTIVICIRNGITEAMLRSP